ncbi:MULTISPECIES: hypothetical protein [unclassified Geodermatophilus]
MGRHTAADGAGTDPIVAAALARQEPAAAGTRHASAADEGTEEGTESGLGWPGDTTTGGGLGWPGSLDEVLRETARMDAVPDVPRAGAAGDVAPDEAGPEAGAELGAPTRRGWRRVFGGSAA